MGFYDAEQPHASLGGKAPDDACFEALTDQAPAAWHQTPTTCQLLNWLSDCPKYGVPLNQRSYNNDDRHNQGASAETAPPWADLARRTGGSGSQQHWTEDRTSLAIARVG